jgi:hypothetical protein
MTSRYQIQYCTNQAVTFSYTIGGYREHMIDGRRQA